MHSSHMVDHKPFPLRSWVPSFTHRKNKKNEENGVYTNLHYINLALLTNNAFIMVQNCKEFYYRIACNFIAKLPSNIAKVKITECAVYLTIDIVHNR